MNTHVRPKKHLGQHFLNDENIAQQIAASLQCNISFTHLLEIGPGTGVLTKYLINHKNFVAAEIDRESIAFLEKKYPPLQIISQDFLQIKLDDLFHESLAIIGNFPYNISSQILFKVLEYHNLVPLVVGMFQKEVAVRIAASPGNKDYGILSVLLQAFYDIEYLFTVDEHVFIPPPKVKSGVIRLVRNQNNKLKCDEAFFFTVVKTAFNQRRKTLRNALKPLTQKTGLPFLDLRAERLSWQDFEELTLAIFSDNKS